MEHQPPWAGTNYEPLLRKLKPETEPWKSEPWEGWWNLIYATALRCGRDSKPGSRGLSGESGPVKARAMGKRHATARRRAEALVVTEPGYLPAKRVELWWGENARLQRQSNAEVRAALPARPNRKPDPSTAGVQHLLELVRGVTGWPRYETVAQLLTLAGRPTSAAWLKKIDPMRKSNR